MNRIKTCAKWFIPGLAVSLVLIQFIPGSRRNPPVTPGHDLLAGTNTPPPKVAAVLRAACYDCHSYETKWPWYSHVAPVSWWIKSHINDGRKHLNFSEWPPGDPARTRRKLHAISENVDGGDMPLPSYTWIHAEARLSVADKKLITDWADAQADQIKTDAAPEK